MKKLFIILIAFSNSLLLSNNYSDIYLMEFENVDSDFTINNLSRALPDIIIQNYEFRGDLSVGYLDKVEPYFPKDSNQVLKQSGLIINGRFSSSEKDVDIEVELYDLSTWELLGEKSFYCPIDNMACIHDAFLIVVDDLLENYIVAEEDRNIASGKKITKRIVYSKDQPVDNSDMFKEALNVNTVDAEFDIQLDDNIDEGIIEEVETVSISKVFDFSSKNTEPSRTPVEVNTEKLDFILDKFLTNPYNITIGEMVVGLNEYDRDIIDFSIPIEFILNKELVDALLSDIPCNILHNKNGNLSIQLSNNDFTFNQALITKLATMRYQIIPIYSFLDKDEEIQLLIIDTWEKKYKGLHIGDNQILHTNQYTPLYTIKSDSDNIYINLNVNTAIVNYAFSVPYNTFGNYTRLVVDFMLEDELDQFLHIDWGNK